MTLKIAIFLVTRYAIPTIVVIIAGVVIDRRKNP
jgi:hypothetical protein